MKLTFNSQISPQVSASLVHRMYQMGAQAVKFRLHGNVLDSESCIAQAMALADYLLSEEGNDEGAELMMTKLGF